MEIPKIELEQIIYFEISNMLDRVNPLDDQDAITCAKQIIKKIKTEERKYESLRPGIAGFKVGE